MTSTYHLRRKEKEITDEQGLDEIIMGEKYLTLAMCRDNEPYLVSLNYGFSPATRCFYIHCAGKGKKIDFIQANPKVWGQVIRDNGYCVGECDHYFDSVHFSGQASFVDTIEEKHTALTLMIDQLEPEPERMKQRLLTESKLHSITILKIEVQDWSGKRNA